MPPGPPCDLTVTGLGDADGGTNQLRGSVFYFARRGSWNETNYILERANDEPDDLTRDDYGFTLGRNPADVSIHLPQLQPPPPSGARIIPAAGMALSQQSGRSRCHDERLPVVRSHIDTAPARKITAPSEQA